MAQHPSLMSPLSVRAAMTPEAQIREAAKTSRRYNRGTRALPDVDSFERVFRRCACVPPEAVRENHVGG